jgi:hypothetical protein
VQKLPSQVQHLHPELRRRELPQMSGPHISDARPAP